MTETHDAFKVDAELEQAFQRALEHELTDEDIDKARLLLGIDLASRQRELNSVATEDALRNWALGVGDDNPRYTDADAGPATRWGDDACIIAMDDSIRKFNYMGDVQFLSGSVVAKREQDGQKVVDLQLHMTNQRQTETAYGAATVALPSRNDGLPLFPPVPVEVARQAATMFARHTELAAERRRQR